MLQMNQNYEPSSRRRLSVFISKRVDPSKILLLNMVYPKQAFPFGPNNSAKNARLVKKPKPIMIT